MRPPAFVVALAVAFGATQQLHAAPPDVKLFTEKVYPVLEKAECRMCHNDNGVSSATRLLFPPEDANAGAIEAFGLRLSALVDRRSPELSLLVRKPTMRIAHSGGERIKKGSPEEAAVLEWVRHLASIPEPELQAARDRLGAGQKRASNSALRRLTHSQYNHTVRDLLGDFTRPADQFPPEDYINGFTNQVDGQTVPPLLAEAYTAAAEKLATNAFRRGDTNKLIPCKPSSPADAACRDRFIRQFGLRAFRRPIAADEARGYATLFSRAATSQRDFVAGARVIVEAMLQSPSFLFHLEDGPAGRYPQYGIASRLSYFLWDTMPNEELFKSAGAGELKDSESIRRVARRMMDNPQAKQALEVFLGQWMRFDRVLSSARSARRYTDFGPSLLSAMTQETRHLFNHLVWNDQNFMELFNANYTFISARLAQLYEMEAPANDFMMVKYPAGSHRAGVLGHGGFLTLTGNPNETSPTSRGLFVREHFLCQHVPPPPPGVDTNLPAANAEKPMTTRERLAMHTTNPSCASCHNLIDPIGSGLEGFDNLGKYREKVTLRIQLQRDSVTNQPRPQQDIDLPLDTKGFIQGIANSNFSNPAELGNILSKDPTCQRCVVKQIFRYAVGRHENGGDQPQLDALYETFKDSGFRFRELLLSLVTSQVFLGRVDDPHQVANLPHRR
jgi:hypothetical protein